MKKTLLILATLVLIILTSSFVSAGLTDDIWAYFSNDNANVSGSISIDISNASYQHNGTISGTTTGAGGKLGEAFMYDKVSDYVETTDTLEMEKDFSYCMWINASENTQYIAGTDKDNTLRSLLVFGAVAEGGTTLKYGCGYYDGAYNFAIATTQSPLNTWVHICCVFDISSEVRIYMNGSSEANTSIGTAGGLNREFSYGMTKSTSFNGTIDEVIVWNRTIGTTEASELYNNSYGNNPFAPPGAPGGSGERNITLHAPSDDQIIKVSNISFNFTPVSNVSAILNCSLEYDGNNLRTANVNNNTFTSFYPSTALPEGNNSWIIECNDSSGTIQSETWDLFVDLTMPSIINFSLIPSVIYTNNNSNVNITASDNLLDIQANLSCYVNGSSVLNQSSVSLTNNTNFAFNQIGSGNYSKGQNLSCNTTVWDEANNQNTASTWKIISNSIPTPPTSIDVSSSAFYYNYLSNFSANGSIDNDNDTITYYYQIYNVNDSVVRQSWSTQDNYTPILGDIGDTLRISSFAYTSDANSTSFNLTIPCYLTRANITIFREKTGGLLNISEADEISLSFICSDDVQVINVSSSNFAMNVSCPYEFIKADATYGNDSYFRIINPAYTSFANISIYMLDLNLDVAVEIIININDLSGDYSEGEIAIQRYLNSSLISVISQPFDIENKATLYLLKDMLYSVVVYNNNNEARALGNLIASSPGEKTLTLPSINFYPDDAILGASVDWNYTYYNNGSGGWIELRYYDTSNSTLNATFLVMNSSNTSNPVYSSTVSNGSAISFTFITGFDPNQTYVSNFTLYRTGLSVVFEQRVYYPGEEPMESVDASLFSNILTWKFWMAIICVLLIGFLFSAESSKIGLVAMMFFLLMFMLWKWIDFGAVGWLLYGLFAVLVALNFLSKSKEVGG